MTTETREYVPVRPRVRRALVQANNNGHNRGAWARVYDIQVHDGTGLTAEQIVAELGSMHDDGECTVTGWGPDRLARFDGAVVILPNGVASAILTPDRRVIHSNIADAFADGIITDF